MSFVKACVRIIRFMTTDRSVHNNYNLASQAFTDTAGAIH